MATLLARDAHGFTLTLPVEPRAQGRAKHTSRGGFVRTYTPKRTREAQDEVRELWMLAGRPVVPDGVPFAAHVLARFARPKSHRGKSGLTAAGRRSVLPRPDVDNIGKLILDALQGHAFTDDLWCWALTVEKQWADEHAVVVTLTW